MPFPMSRPVSRFLLSSGLAALLLVPGCGGGGGGSAAAAPVVTVTLLPATPTVATGGHLDFTATVSGSANTGVAWSVLEAGGGSITTSGAYLAPAAAGTYHVVATSQADPTKSATSTVNVFLGGSARVYQTGLPVGTVAPLQVSGPDGYAATFTQQDQTLTGLPAGTYTFSFPTVNAAGTAFLPVEPGTTATKTLNAGGSLFFGVSYAPQPGPGVGSITATNASMTDHIDPGAVQLGNGRVLVVAGVTVFCEEFDPVAGTFGSSSVMAVNRGFETPLALLNSGQVLVAGGGYPSPVAATELYTPATKAWTSTGALATPRFHHTLTLLQDGRVLAVGGSTTAPGTAAVGSAEIYSPGAGTWAPVAGDLATPRMHHTATLLPNGKVLVAGGQGASGPLDSAELFDPATGTFTPLTSKMASGHVHHEAVALPSGKVVIAGGFGSGYALPIEVYSPATNAFTSPASLLLPRTYLAAAALPDGRVLIVGGMSQGDATASTELFNPADNSIRFGPNLTQSRQEHRALTLANGRVLILGGRGLNNVARKTADLYVP